MTAVTRPIIRPVAPFAGASPVALTEPDGSALGLPSPWDVPGESSPTPNSVHHFAVCVDEDGRERPVAFGWVKTWAFTDLEFTTFVHRLAKAAAPDEVLSHRVTHHETTTGCRCAAIHQLHPLDTTVGMLLLERAAVSLYHPASGTAMQIELQTAEARAFEDIVHFATTLLEALMSEAVHG